MMEFLRSAAGARIPRDAVQALLDGPLPCMLIAADGALRALSRGAAELISGAQLGQPIAPLLGGVGVSPLSDLIGGVADAADGSLIPLLVQAAPVEDGGFFLALVDLRPIREAEERRFERTPYGTMRIDRNGRVRYANAAARRLWQREELTDVEFATLFDRAVALRVQEAMTTVLHREDPRTLDIEERFGISAGSLRFPSQPRLTLLPDYAPGGQLVGLVAVLRERILDAVRLQLRAAASGEGGNGEASRQWQERLADVLKVLQLAVPFAGASLVRLSACGFWSRPIFAWPPRNEEQEPAPQAWVPVSETWRERIRAGRPFPFELQDLDRDVALRGTAALARHKESGMLSHVALPFPEGQPEAALVLFSREAELFAEPEEPAGTPPAAAEDAWPLPPFRAFQALGLDGLMTGMLRRIERQESIAQRDIQDSIEDAETVPQAVAILLEALVRHFGWDHAAVFIADRSASSPRFRLFAQYPEVEGDKPHPLAVDAGYSQPLYDPPDDEPFDEAQARLSGMLGAALRDARRPEGGVLVASDVSKPEVRGRPPYWFRAVCELQASALTMAISIEGRTRWVLDTVSRQPNAFIQEDGRRVGRLVRRLAQRVAALRRARLNGALIDLVEQGVVVTDSGGSVLEANERARNMLGLPPGTVPTGHRLAAHICEPDAALPLLHLQERRLRMGPLGGIGSMVRVCRRNDLAETGDVVWLLASEDLQDWTYEHSYIEETVQEVARQVRGPLLMASALAGRLAKRAGEIAAPVVQQVQAEIGKADITFERLAEAIGAKREPRRTVERVDLVSLVLQTVERLPEEDRRELIKLSLPEQAEVDGDPARLGFVLRTLLGHLVTHAARRVEISLERASDGLLTLRLFADLLPVATPAAADPATEAALAAREAAGRALDAVRRVVEAHGGELETRLEGYVLSLPSLSAEVQA